MKSFKSLRSPWKIGEQRIFGDLLPFVGFETIEASAKEVAEHYDVEMDPRVILLYGQFFTIEWLGRGFSMGGFRVPIED